MGQLSAKEIYAAARVGGFSPDEAVTMTAIALAESGGDPQAHNPNGENSRGLWQINLDAHSEWAGGMDLFDPLQNARAAREVYRGQSISAWTVTHGGTNARYLQHRATAQEAAAANGEPDAEGAWTGTSGYGHQVSAGDATGADVDEVELLTTPDSDADDTALREFLDAAIAQSGDTYVFGATAALDDPDPDAFDCSELVKWAAHQAGVTVPDGSYAQYLHLKEAGMLIPVEEAMDTPGALLFSFSSEPTPGGGRPSQAHVAIALGHDDMTIEARGKDYGVGSWSAQGRFNYAAVVPGLDGELTAELEAGNIPPELDPDSGDVDGDGLTGALEAQLGTDPESEDTDLDGLSDGYEVGTLGTDPLASDSDRDGVADSIELTTGTDPLDPDSNRDGVLDGAESRGDAFVDSDNDLMADDLEALLGLDATSIDSDADGFTDFLEYQQGFDPLDPTSNPMAVGPADAGPQTGEFEVEPDADAELSLADEALGGD